MRRRPTGPAAGPLLPLAADRLLRGLGRRTCHYLACRGFVRAAGVSWAGVARGAAGSLDDFAHASVDRPRDARGCLYLEGETSLAAGQHDTAQRHADTAQSDGWNAFGLMRKPQTSEADSWAPRPDMGTDSRRCPRATLRPLGSYRLLLLRLRLVGRSRRPPVCLRNASTIWMKLRIVRSA